MTEPSRTGGHNRVGTQALTSVARAVASEVLEVSPSSVHVDWSDDGGLLALALALPIGIPSLVQVMTDRTAVDDHGGSVRHRAHAAKPVILDRVSSLTGSRLSRVDIRITGVKVTERSKVR